MTATQVELRDEGGVVVACLAGEIDLADTAEISARVLGGVPNEAAGLVVDLSAVRYLDSAGIQMLFEFTRQLEAGRQGMAVVVGAASFVRTLLEITGMQQAVAVCGTQSEAVAAVREGGGRSY